MARQTGLRDRVVIITGAAAGIGRATALRFAEEGSRIAVWDMREEEPTIGQDIKKRGGQLLYLRVDVRKRDQVEDAVAQVASHYGRIDVLINNAGILQDAQLVGWKENKVVSTMSDETWGAVVETNLTSVFFCTRAVVPHMIKGGGGVILNASSVVAMYGNFGETNYVATKAGLIGMTRVWARELGRHKIRVNAVAPGFVATDILNAVPAKVTQSMIEHTPLRRLGSPEDIAEAYLWLASDSAGFVHGAVLSVDGGLVVGT